MISTQTINKSIDYFFSSAVSVFYFILPLTVFTLIGSIELVTKHAIPFILILAIPTAIISLGLIYLFVNLKHHPERKVKMGEGRREFVNKRLLGKRKGTPHTLLEQTIKYDEKVFDKMVMAVNIIFVLIALSIPLIYAVLLGLIVRVFSFGFAFAFGIVTLLIFFVLLYRALKQSNFSPKQLYYSGRDKIRTMFR